MGFSIALQLKVLSFEGSLKSLIYLIHLGSDIVKKDGKSALVFKPINSKPSSTRLHTPIDTKPIIKKPISSKIN